MKIDPICNDTEAFMFLRRVEKLERENKKLKRIAFVFGVGVLGFFTMGQVHVPKVIPKVIEAERFVLKDAAGKEKATLGMTDNGPALELKETIGRSDPITVGTSLNAGLLTMSGGPGTTGKTDKEMFIGRGGVFFYDVTDTGERKARLKMSSSPTIEIEDEQGFKTTIGRTDLEIVKTGESRKTSAASMVIFDKDGKVIWRAPIQ